MNLKLKEVFRNCVSYFSVEIHGISTQIGTYTLVHVNI